MDVKMLRPDSSEWLECLSRFAHDFYYLPEYVQLCADQANGEAVGCCVIDRENILFQPFIIRPIISFKVGKPLFDATSPYGYAGPLISSTEGGRDATTQASFPRRALACLFSDMRRRSIVSAFITPHPLLQTNLEAICFNGHLTLLGHTVAIDVSATLQEIWAQTRSDHRSGINKAYRNGYKAEVVDFYAHLEVFCSIYAETMERVQASERYLFSREYFLKLKSALGEKLHLCIVRVNNNIVCAGLFTELGGIVQFHLSGTTNIGLPFYPSKFMIHYMSQWAKERGNRFLHLGSGLGGRRDSLFEFKAGFSKVYTPYFTWRVILDQSLYQDLVTQWELLNGVPSEDMDGFFPAYRKHMPDVHGVTLL